MATVTLAAVSTVQAVSISSTFLLPHSSSFRSSSPRICKIVKKNNSKNIYCRSDNRSPSPEESNSNNNILLKLAWYGSEALGIAASVFRPSTTAQPSGEKSSQDEIVGSIPKDAVVDAIKKDFEKSYFVTGNLTTIIYEEDCEFADPAGSFRGLRRFKRNCSNFGSLLEKSNMKLMNWEDFEDRGIGHWRFICVLAFPWRPILSATGYTEYYYDDQSRKICRHVEHWNVPKMVLLKQIFKPNPGLWRK